MTTSEKLKIESQLSIIEENKTIVRKLMEAVNNQDLAALDDLIVPEYVNEQLSITNLDEFKEVLREQYQGFPNVHRTIEDIVAEGDKVWIRVRITATHSGEYRGVAPTGKKILMAAVPAYRIVDGKLIEGWSIWNPMGMFKQLGVIEYKGFPDESKDKPPTIARRSSKE